jgi:hypothetical protein
MKGKRILNLSSGIVALLIAACNSISSTPKMHYPKIQTIMASQDISSQIAEPIEVEPGELGIYYGWPSMVEGSRGNLEHAVKAFSNLEYLILGASLEMENHRDHYNTKQIIESLIKLNVEVYGYIDLGNDMNTSRFGLSEINSCVGKWKDMGVTGIFFDDAYPAFDVDKERLSQALSYVKERKMKMIINSHDIMWAISTGAVGKESEGYSLLIEPFLVSRGEYVSQEYFAQTELTVKYYTDQGYAFHGVAHYNEKASQEQKQTMNTVIQKKAKDLQLKSVAFTNECYSGSGSEQNRLILYDK